ncbi:MAG: histidinol-phosphate transaminase [Oscillospiraceae bacterium]|nr:histidinol-phosphate transaminase [Oscillospiraceae bacterium]
MSLYMDKKYRAIEPYTPGEQPTAGKFIKLNTNENPYGPSPEVQKAVEEEAKRLNLYSDPECGVFLSTLADYLNIGKKQVFASNGSDEVLAFVFQAFAEKGVAFADLTYGFYPVYAALYGVDAKLIPLTEDFTLRPDDYYNLEKTIVLANPNAPTGLAVGVSDLRGILEHNRGNLVVVDEAYVDFGAESAVCLLEDYDNLLIIGTFSKSRSMAGARLGYAAGSEELIASLNKIKFSFNPYNVNRMTLAAGAAALRDDAWFRNARDKIVLAREHTLRALREMGFICTDSKANFIFTRHPEKPGKGLFLGLREAGILVRRFDKERIADWLRISVGTMDDMNALITALRKIL